MRHHVEKRTRHVSPLRRRPGRRDLHRRRPAPRRRSAARRLARHDGAQERDHVVPEHSRARRDRTRARTQAHAERRARNGRNHRGRPRDRRLPSYELRQREQRARRGRGAKLGRFDRRRDSRSRGIDSAALAAHRVDESGACCTARACDRRPDRRALPAGRRKSGLQSPDEAAAGCESGTVADTHCYGRFPRDSARGAASCEAATAADTRCDRRFPRDSARGAASCEAATVADARCDRRFPRDSARGAASCEACHRRRRALRPSLPARFRFRRRKSRSHHRRQHGSQPPTPHARYRSRAACRPPAPRLPTTI